MNSLKKIIIILVIQIQEILMMLQSETITGIQKYMIEFDLQRKEVQAKFESMNIEDKARLFHEFKRVLTPGGTLGVFDVNEDGSAKYRDYADYIVNHERTPGVGSLMGWRGEDGSQEGKGAVNPKQLEKYIENGCYWRRELKPNELLSLTSFSLIST